MAIPDVRALLPHAGPMVLLDRVLTADADGLTAEVTIRTDSQFFDGQGVGAWIGLEYMAQTTAAFAGYEALLANGVVKPGFLLGTRRYNCSVPVFPLGVALRVTTRRELQGASGLGSFTCTIDGDGIVADAIIAVFQPDNVDAFLQGRTE